MEPGQLARSDEAVRTDARGERERRPHRDAVVHQRVGGEVQYPEVGELGPLEEILARVQAEPHDRALRVPGDLPRFPARPAQPRQPARGGERELIRLRRRSARGRIRRAGKRGIAEDQQPSRAARRDAPSLPPERRDQRGRRRDPDCVTFHGVAPVAQSERVPRHSMQRAVGHDHEPGHVRRQLGHSRLEQQATQCGRVGRHILAAGDECQEPRDRPGERVRRRQDAGADLGATALPGHDEHRSRRAERAGDELEQRRVVGQLGRDVRHADPLELVGLVREPRLPPLQRRVLEQPVGQLAGAAALRQRERRLGAAAGSEGREHARHAGVPVVLRGSVGLKRGDSQVPGAERGTPAVQLVGAGAQLLFRLRQVAEPRVRIGEVGAGFVPLQVRRGIQPLELPGEGAGGGGVVPTVEREPAPLEPLLRPPLRRAEAAEQGLRAVERLLGGEPVALPDRDVGERLHHLRLVLQIALAAEEVQRHERLHQRGGIVARRQAHQRAPGAAHHERFGVGHRGGRGHRLVEVSGRGVIVVEREEELAEEQLGHRLRVLVVRQHGVHLRLGQHFARVAVVGQVLPQRDRLPDQRQRAAAPVVRALQHVGEFSVDRRRRVRMSPVSERDRPRAHARSAGARIVHLPRERRRAREPGHALCPPQDDQRVRLAAAGRGLEIDRAARHDTERRVVVRERGLEPGRARADVAHPEQRLRFGGAVAERAGLAQRVGQEPLDIRHAAVLVVPLRHAEAGVDRVRVGAAGSGDETAVESLGERIVVGEPGEGGEAERGGAVGGIAGEARLPAGPQAGRTVAAHRGPGRAHDGARALGSLGPVGRGNGRRECRQRDGEERSGHRYPRSGDSRFS